MRNKDLAYWLCTAVIAFVFASGGLVYLMSVPPAVEGVMHLGFPFYFVTLLGGVVILLPGFARVEEWLMPACCLISPAPRLLPRLRLRARHGGTLSRRWR